MAKELNQEERRLAHDMLDRARAAMAQVEDYSQEQLDRLAQAIGWYAGNEKTFTELAQMGVDESGIGDRAGRPAKRFKIHGVLRDALRQASTGIVEVDDAKGLVKYAKPAGVIASLIPMTNPALTPPVTGIYSAKTRNAAIFSPHPRTAETTWKMVEVMRNACRAVGAPEDLFQSVRHPSIPLTQYLMEICDLTLATGGKPMVKAAYSSGKPAYGVGAGNSSIVIDETADIEIAAANTRMSKTSDFGSGCSADGNIIIQDNIYDQMIAALQAEGGYLCNEAEKTQLEAAMWDEKGNRTFPTIACPPQQTAKVAGFTVPDDAKFLMVENQGQIGAEHKFSKE
jgi:sulfoacetaldehyde dehydrogenase